MYPQPDPFNLIIDPSDAAWLESRNLMTAPDQEVRSIHLSLMTYDSSVKSINSESFITIPIELESLETLKYMGYDSHAAQLLWQGWVDKDLEAENGDYFLRYATRHIRRDHPSPGPVGPDAEGNDIAEWTATLRACGLSQECQDSILDPAHTQVRLTQSAKYWIVDTLEIRYGALQEARGVSKIRAQKIGASPHYWDPLTPIVGVHPANQSNITAVSGISLFTGIASCRLWRGRDGTLDSTPIQPSNNPTDFSSKRDNLVYYTPQHWFAEHYAKYAKRRQGAGGKVLILKTVFPSTYIDTLSKRVFTFGDDWKHVVSNSLQGNWASGLPHGLSSIRKNILIIGPILKSHNVGITKMTGIEQITENDMVRNEFTGEVAFQHAFRGGYLSDSLEGVPFSLDILSEVF